MSKMARGSNYFHNVDFPICIKRIEPDTKTTHHYDLTFVNHHHDFSELVIVTKGKGVQSIKGVEYHVKAGDVFLLKDYDEHYFIEQDNISLINIMFDETTLLLPKKLFGTIPSYKAIFELEPKLRQKHNFNSHLKLTHRKILEISAIANQISEEVETRNPGYKPAAFSYLIQLITIICREYSKIKTNNGKSILRVSQIIAKLEQDYNKQWTLKQLAKAASMSENNLLLCFKEATGLSPIAYANNVKINIASMLLRSTSDTITEIAFKCGFNDSNYFTRLFKNKHKVSPLKFRKYL